MAQSNEQVSKYEKKTKEAAALLHYSKEALNEVDPASFLLVSYQICDGYSIIKNMFGET